MGSLSSEYLPHYTYDEYCLWDGNWELFEGIPVAMSPAPSITHQAIAAKFIAQLDNQVDICPRCLVLGEEDYKLADDTVLRPDVVLICDESNDAYITKAPEIVIEIVSKSTAKNDENYKFHKYEQEKIKYYIIVYPDKLLAKVYKLRADRYHKESDFTDNLYNFDDSLCKVSLDFAKIFKRFK